VPPSQFFHSMPRSARKYFWNSIYNIVYVQSVSQWREASIICESSGEGNRSSAAAALRLRLHRHSSRSASSNVFALPFAYSSTTKNLPAPSSGFQCRLLLCCCHLIFIAEILLCSVFSVTFVVGEVFQQRLVIRLRVCCSELETACCAAIWTPQHLH
jgi:hypothetical protein